MPKIKRKVEMTFIELLNYVWSNKIKNKTFYSTYSGGSAFFDEYQVLYLEHEVHKNEKFTVEIEEEITEDTVLEEIYEYTTYNHFITYYDETIDYVKDIDTKEFWVKDGVNMTLIWKDGAMVD